MLTSIDRNFPTAVDRSDQNIAPAADRRSANRALSMFRPGCLIIENRIVLGMIRNISTDGVMIEVEEALQRGQEVAYFWDENCIVSAKVAWSDGKRHGLSNHCEQTLFDRQFTHRSLRVPCAIEVKAWVNGDLQRPLATNLSLGGVQLCNLSAKRGDRLTIKIGSVELYNAEVRWNGTDRVGVKFDQRLSQSQLSAILAENHVSFERQ